MKTESMIERAARAMCVSDEMDPDSLGIGDVPAYWLHYAGMARAAIEAMREQSNEAIGNALVAFLTAIPATSTEFIGESDDYKRGLLHGQKIIMGRQIQAAHDALIDAALSEEGE